MCLCYLAAKQNTEGLALSCHFTARPLPVCTVLGVETQALADRHGERTWFGYAEISRRAWSVVWAISGGIHRTGHRPTKGAPVNTGRAVCRSTIDTSFSGCSWWCVAPATPAFGSTHTHTHPRADIGTNYQCSHHGALLQQALGAHAL